MSNRKTHLAQAKSLIPDMAGILTAVFSIALFFYFGKLLSGTPKVELSDYIQIMILIFIAGTMGTAIWGHIKNSEFSRSNAYLENSIELINRARGVLTKPSGEITNDRVSWVTAARLITRAQHIASAISIEAHQKIFEAEHDYQRHAFGNFLKHNGEPLSSSFFCGAEFSGLSIGEAIHHPSQGRHGDKWIPPRIIAVIYSFFQYPKDYEDPLDASLELSKEEIQRLWIFGEQGVCDYLTFRKSFKRIGNNVMQFNSGRKISEHMTADQVNREMIGLSGLDE